MPQLLKAPPTITSDTVQGSSNYSIYDTWVKRTTPLILLGYHKGDQNAYFELRALCLTADIVAKGSRIPPAGAVSSGVERLTGSRRELDMLLAVSVFGAAMSLL